LDNLDTTLKREIKLSMTAEDLGNKVIRSALPTICTKKSND